MDFGVTKNSARIVEDCLLHLTTRKMVLILGYQEFEPKGSMSKLIFR
jgi:hypothetical protein